MALQRTNKYTLTRESEACHIQENDRQYGLERKEANTNKKQEHPKYMMLFKDGLR